MKPGPANPKQRSRGRSNNGGGGGGGNGGGGNVRKHMPPRNQTFDSNGPDVRIRGNAHQVLEKYLAMARDAASQGDRVAAENYYQHAEHYYRVINANNQNGQRQQRHAPSPAEDQMLPPEGDGDGEGEAEGNGNAAPAAGADGENAERTEDGQQEAVNA